MPATRDIRRWSAIAALLAISCGGASLPPTRATAISGTGAPLVLAVDRADAAKVNATATAPYDVASAPSSGPVTTPLPPSEVLAAASSSELEASVAPRLVPEGVTRPRTVPVPFAIEDLPLGAIPEAPSATSAPSALPKGDDVGLMIVEADGTLAPKMTRVDSLMTRTVRISTPAVLSRLRIGLSEASGDVPTILLQCGGLSRAVLLPMRVESLVVSTSAPPAYVVMDGWFNTRACAGVITNRARIEVKSIAGGILFASREQCATCATTHAIHLFGPRATQTVVGGLGGDAAMTKSVGAFSVATLPVVRGGGGALMVRFPATSMREWHDRTGSPDIGESVVDVEVVQGIAEATPSAVVYVAKPRVSVVKAR